MRVFTWDRYTRDCLIVKQHIIHKNWSLSIVFISVICFWYCCSFIFWYFLFIKTRFTILYCFIIFLFNVNNHITNVAEFHFDFILLFLICYFNIIFYYYISVFINIQYKNQLLYYKYLKLYIDYNNKYQFFKYEIIN